MPGSDKPFERIREFEYRAIVKCADGARKGPN